MQTSGGIVEYCYTDNIGANNLNSAGPVGIIMSDGINNTFQFCEATNTKTANHVDGEGFDIDLGSQDCTVQYCYAHNNYGAGIFVFASGSGVTNPTVRYCVFQDNGTDASDNSVAEIFVWNSSGGISGANIYNNTCYNSNHTGNPVFRVAGTITGSRVCNNIFYSAAGAGQNIVSNANTSMTFDGNCYFTTSTFAISWNGTGYSTLAAWKSATGQEAVNGGFTANPLLNSPGAGGTLGPNLTTASNASLTAYKLQAASPMIGVGINLSSAFSINPGSLDFFGNSIPNGSGTGFNVGAYGGT